MKTDIPPDPLTAMIAETMLGISDGMKIKELPLTDAQKGLVQAVCFSAFLSGISVATQTLMAEDGSKNVTPQNMFHSAKMLADKLGYGGMNITTTINPDRSDA